MDKAKLDELVLAVAAKSARAQIDALSAELKNAGNPLPETISSSLNVLWENWSGKELDTASAELCMLAASCGTADSPEAEALRSRIGLLFARTEGTMN